MSLSFAAPKFAKLTDACIAVPVDTTTIKTLYVFVEIAVDRAHLAASIRLNFPHCIPPPPGIRGSSKGKGPELEIAIDSATAPTPAPAPEAAEKPTKLAVVGTIQFVAAVQGLKTDLETEVPEDELLPERLAIEASKEGGEDKKMEVDEPPKSVGREAQSKFEVSVPQVKPLSPGEILGCTAPRLDPETDALM